MKVMYVASGRWKTAPLIRGLANLPRIALFLVRFGEDILQQIQQERIDILIIEAVAPMEKTLALLMRTRQRYSFLELPILVMIAREEHHHAVNILSSGANDFMSSKASPLMAAAKVSALMKARAQYRHLAQTTTRRRKDQDPTYEPTFNMEQQATFHPGKSETESLISLSLRHVPVTIPVTTPGPQCQPLGRTLKIGPTKIGLVTSSELPDHELKRIRLCPPRGPFMEIEVQELSREPLDNQQDGLKIALLIVSCSDVYADFFDLLQQAFRQGGLTRLINELKDPNLLKGEEPSQEVEAESNPLHLSPPVTAPRTIQGARYQFLRRLGRGGFANVFLVRDLVLKRKVVMKVLNRRYANDPVIRHNFLFEARVAAQFNHPNIVMLLEVGECFAEDYQAFLEFPPKIMAQFPERFIYFTMKYEEAVPLSQYLGEEKALPPREALRVLTDVAKALAFAHRKGVIHRDIKPQNILITKEKKVIVTDFGIAKIQDSSEDDNLQADQEKSKVTLLCTPTYASPEQLTGHRLDERSDIYSFGVLAYKLFTGKLPFKEKTAHKMASRKIHGQFTRMPQNHCRFPIKIHEMVEKCLEPKPRHRYQSLDELFYELNFIHEIFRDTEMTNQEQTLLRLMDQVIVAEDINASRQVLNHLTTFFKLHQTYDSKEDLAQLKNLASEPHFLDILLLRNLNESNLAALHTFFKTLDSSNAIFAMLHQLPKETSPWRRCAITEIAILTSQSDLLPLVSFALNQGDEDAFLILRTFEKRQKMTMDIMLKWMGHTGTKTQAHLREMIRNGPWNPKEKHAFLTAMDKIENDPKGQQYLEELRSVLALSPSEEGAGAPKAISA